MTVKKILEKLVATPSVFPQEQHLAELLETFLTQEGFEVERVQLANKRWNILAERGTVGRPVVFYGHMDTVPDYGNWQTNPFELVKQGDRLYGLGACDMKGGIAGILAAIAKAPRERKVKLVFVADEENNSEGAWQIAKERKEWFRDCLGLLSTEPGASKQQTGGVNVITLGRRGRVVYMISVFGKSVHGAHPEKGVNAIDEAATIISALKQVDLPTHELLGSGSQFVRKVSGEATSLSLPDHASIELDRHLIVPETIDSAKDQLQQLLTTLYATQQLSEQADQKATVTVKKRETPYMVPYLTEEQNAFALQVTQLVTTHFGSPIFNYGKSVADDNVFATELGLPVVTIGPEGGNIHGSNEWVSEKSLTEVAQLYQLIIEQVT